MLTVCVRRSMLNRKRPTLKKWHMKRKRPSRMLPLGSWLKKLELRWRQWRGEGHSRWVLALAKQSLSWLKEYLLNLCCNTLFSCLHTFKTHTFSLKHTHSTSFASDLRFYSAIIEVTIVLTVSEYSQFINLSVFIMFNFVGHSQGTIWSTCF